MIIHSGWLANTQLSRHLYCEAVHASHFILKQVSEISFVRHVGNHLNVRITWKCTGGRTQGKHLSSKLRAEKEIWMQLCHDLNPILFFIHFAFFFFFPLASFRCEICGYQCRQRASLNWHMKKHTPEAQYNYTCEFCHKRFEKLDSVKFHKVKSHPDKQTT